jgi:hypothetical protein
LRTQYPPLRHTLCAPPLASQWDVDGIFHCLLLLSLHAAAAAPAQQATPAAAAAVAVLQASIWDVDGTGMQQVPTAQLDLALRKVRRQ